MKKKLQARIYIEILGWTYFKMGNYEDSERFIKQGIDIAKDEQDKQLLSYGIGRLCKIYREQDRLKEAKTLIADALKLAKQIKDQFMINYLISDLAQIERLSGNYEKAESLLKKALANFKKLGA